MQTALVPFPPLPRHQHPHPNLGEIARLMPQIVAPELVEFLHAYASVHPYDHLPNAGTFDIATRPYLQRYYLVTVPEGTYMPGGGQNAHMGFRIVAAGAEVARAFRFPLADRLLQEIAETDDPHFRYAAALAADVTRRRQIAHYRGPARLTDSAAFAMVEYCSCPLADDGHTVDRIVTALVYQQGAEANA